MHAEIGGSRDGLVREDRGPVPGSIPPPLANTGSHSNSNSHNNSSSSSGSSSRKHTRGGYEVLGRTLAEWEIFVLEGPETQKRY